ncbi:MAG: hypothetical protein ACKO6N_12330 [Myxococcota bacterium]
MRKPRGWSTLSFYDRLVERVDKRLRVYKNRLGIEHHDALKI